MIDFAVGADVNEAFRAAVLATSATSVACRSTYAAGSRPEPTQIKRIGIDTSKVVFTLPASPRQISRCCVSISAAPK